MKTWLLNFRGHTQAARLSWSWPGCTARSNSKGGNLHPQGLDRPRESKGGTRLETSWKKFCPRGCLLGKGASSVNPRAGDVMGRSCERSDRECTSHAKSPRWRQGWVSGEGDIPEEPTKHPMKERGERVPLWVSCSPPPTKFVEVLTPNICECDLICEWGCDLCHW